jgi:hypothetical protein
MMTEQRPAGSCLPRPDGAEHRRAVRPAMGEGQAGQASGGSFRRRLRTHWRTHFRAPTRCGPYFPWTTHLSRLLPLRHDPLLSSLFLLSVVEEIIGLRGGPTPSQPRRAGCADRGPDGTDGEAGLMAGKRETNAAGSSNC